MSIERISKYRRIFLFVINFVIFKIFNEIIYSGIVSRIFEYSGLIYEPNFYKCVLSYLIFFALLIVIPKNFSKTSSYLINIIFIFTITPLLSFYWQSDSSTIYIVFCTLSFALTCLLLKLNIKVKRKRSLLKLISIEYTLIFIIVIFLVAFSLAYGFPDFRALNFQNVYSVRGERTYTTAWGYLINWIPSAFIPSLMCISMYKNKRILTFLTIMIQVYMYLFTANKTVLFSVALILISFYIIRKNKNFSISWIWILMISQAIAAIVYWSFGTIDLISIVPVRLSNIPAQISFDHYNFFSLNQKLYFSETIIGRLLGIESPYPVFSTYLVSRSKIANANTGYLGDAYDNGGFILMIIYSMIVGFVLRFVDRISIPKLLPVFVSVLTYSMIILNDAPLLTTLLTGGLTLNILILYIFRTQEK